MNSWEEYDVHKKFINFVFLKTAEERREFLNNNDLLSEEIIEVIQNQANKNGSEEFIEHYNLLKDCKKNGIEKLDYFFSIRELQMMFVEFCEGFNSFEERKDYLKHHIELCSEKALRSIEAYIENRMQEKWFRGDYLTKARLYRNLLKDANTKGIEDVFKEYGIPSEKTVNMVNQLLRADNAYQAFGPHIYLCENKSDAQKMVNMLIAKNEDNQEFMKMIDAICVSLDISVRTEIIKYPKMDRRYFLPNRHEDSAWGEGIFKDGRPFRVELWFQMGCTYLSYYISTIGIENASTAYLREMLISEGLINFNDQKFREGFGHDGLNLGAKKFVDDSNNEMWSLTVIVGDEDGTYVQDHFPLQKYKFPSKEADPFLYTNEGKNIDTAEYFIAICEKALEDKNNYYIYQSYFINNTLNTIDLLIESGSGNIMKIIESINDLDTGFIDDHKGIYKYENIQPKNFVKLFMRFFDWDFDWPNELHFFIKVSGDKHHAHFYMGKYFIADKKVNIPILNRMGWVCL